MIIGISGVAGVGKDTVADFLVKNKQCVKVALADPLKRICKEVFDFTDEQLWGPSASRNAPDLRYKHPSAGMRSHLYDEAYGGNGVRCAACGSVFDCAHEMPKTDCSNGSTKTHPLLTHLTPRYALQKLGTEWGRDCYDNVWVEYALRTAKELIAGGYVYSAKNGLESEYGHPRSPQYPYKGVVIPDVRFRNEVDGIKAAGGKLIRIYRPQAGLEGAAAQHRSETEQSEIKDSEFNYLIHNTGTLGRLEQLALDAWFWLQAPPK